MKKIYGVLAFIGIFIWSAAIFLRDTPLMDYEIIKRVLGVAPNFGVVWAGVGFAYIFFPYVFKKDFNEKYTSLLISIILTLLIVSEIVHHLFLSSPFDIWDMIASITASIVIVLVDILHKRIYKM